MSKNAVDVLLLIGTLISCVSCRDRSDAGPPPIPPGVTVVTAPAHEIPARIEGMDETGDGFYASTFGEKSGYETWVWHDGTMVKGPTFTKPPDVDDVYHLTIVRDGRYLGQVYRNPGPGCKASLVLAAIETGKVIKEWVPPAGWELISGEPGLSGNGKFAAVVLDEDVPNNPDWDWKHPRCRVGLINLTSSELTWVSRLDGNGAATIRRIAVSDDGRYIAIGGWANGVALIDAQAHKVLWKDRPPTEVSTGYVRFSADGLTFYSAGSEGCVYEHETLTGKIKGKWWASETGESQYGHRITGLAISPDGKWRAAGTGPEGYVYLWNVPASKLAILKHEGGTISVVTFSPDSKYLASVAGGKIKIWDVSLVESQQANSQPAGAATSGPTTAGS